MQPLARPLDTPHTATAAVPHVEIRTTPRGALQLAVVDLCGGCGSSGEPDRMVFCADCGEAYHSYCAGPTDEAVQPSLAGVWRCSVCATCEVCDNKPQNAGRPQVSCAGCGVGVHVVCLVPELTVADRALPLYCHRCFSCALCRRTKSRASWSRSMHACLQCAYPKAYEHLLK